MPQALDYSYIPQYGVEPYVDSVAGGAVVTGDNLIVSLWTAENKGGVPPAPYITIEQIVRPSTINSDEPANIRPAYGKAFHSRCSARFLFIPNELEWPVVAVLNPPQEYKQQLVDAVRYIGDSGSDPTDLANYQVLKSLQACLAWQLPAFAGLVDVINCTSNSSNIEAMFSEYLPLGPVAAGGVARTLPFLRTNGADGVTPEFFDVSTVAGVQAMIAAVNRGDFYVAAFLLNASDSGDPAHCEIRWPHSAARG